MLTNYIYAFKLHKYNIKIKSHIIFIINLILSFWKWFGHTNNSIYIYIIHPLPLTPSTWFLQHKRIYTESKDMNITFQNGNS
jgi:hypothetical protein